MQKKKSLNEQAKEAYVDEFSSGKVWNSDAPPPPNSNSFVDKQDVMNSGACGAFVHGLEDEMMGKEEKMLLLLLLAMLFGGVGVCCL